MAYGTPGRFGGTATWGNLDDPKTFNPGIINEASSVAVTWHLFDALCEEVGDDLSVRPALAAKWTLSPDGKHYLFILRKNLQWSDGAPLTVDDVLFTFREVMFNPNVPAANDPLKVPFQGKAVFPAIRKVDSTSVRFDLPSPYAPFLRALASVPILPHHRLEKTLREKDKSGNPRFNQTWGIDTPPSQIIGSGPFVLEEFSPAQRVVFRRNPFYWRFDRKNRRLPYLDRLVYSFSKDISGLTIKFLAKEIDVVGARGRQYELLKPLEKAQRFRIVNAGPDVETPFLMFNLNRGKDKKGRPFVDPMKQNWLNETRFRQAVAHAIDKRTIVANAYNFIAVPQAAEFGARHPFYDARLQGAPYDLAKAKALLEEAGFVRKGPTLTDAQGHPVVLNLTTFTGNPLATQIPLIIKTDLEKLGMKVNVRPLQFNTCIEKLDRAYDWELMFLPWSTSVDPHPSAALWKSDGGSHFFRPVGAIAPWEQELNRLMDEGAVTPQEAKRKEIYSRVQSIVLREAPMIFLAAPLYLVAVREDLGNVRPCPFNVAAPSCWNAYEIYRQGERI